MTQKGPTTTPDGNDREQVIWGSLPQSLDAGRQHPHQFCGFGEGSKIIKRAKDTGSGVQHLWIVAHVPALANCEILSKLSTLPVFSSERWE